MENPIIDLIHQHVSIRRYTREPVTQEMIETIVKAGQKASTSSNLQIYSVVAVMDEQKLTALAKIADQEFIATAPVVLVWCADLARLDRVCQLQGLEQQVGYVDNFLLAAVDASLAAQNAALAAESLGLGMCYLGALRKDAGGVIKLLQLPRLVFPVFGMAIGWPESKPAIKPRLPLKAVLHWETYDTHLDDQLKAYDQEMAQTGMYVGRQSPYPGREGVMENYGWLEHSARKAARGARQDLRTVLEEQGFLLK